MKISTFFFKLTLVCFALTMLSGQRITKREVAPHLLGTWQLKHFKHGDAQNHLALPKGHTKKKIITESHFSWYEYDANGKLIALGGGSYEFNGTTYTETIEYYYPPSSSLLGTSIPFSCKMENSNKWVHIGYIHQQEIDSETGKYTVTNTHKLEEIWERQKAD